MTATPDFATLEAAMTAVISDQILNRWAIEGVSIREATDFVANEWMTRSYGDGLDMEVVQALSDFIQRVGDAVAAQL